MSVIKKEHKGVNILVCGSKVFQNKSFVYNVLDKMLLNMKIQSILYDDLSDFVKFAVEWAKDNKVNFGLFDIFNDGSTFLAGKKLPKSVSQKNHVLSSSVFNGKKLPVSILKNEECFVTVQQKLMTTGISYVVTSPAEEDKNNLSPTTTNLIAIAKLIGIQIIENENFFKHIKQKKKEEPNQKFSLKNIKI